MLVKSNVIMYANVTLPLILVSNKLDAPYFSMLHQIQWDKNLNCFCLFKEIVQKLTVNFGNCISQDSHKNQYHCLVLNFSFTEPQYSDKCWSNFSLKCHIFTIACTQRRYSSTCWSSNSCSNRFIWNQLPRIIIIILLQGQKNDVITVPGYLL